MVIQLFPFTGGGLQSLYIEATRLITTSLSRPADARHTGRLCVADVLFHRPLLVHTRDATVTVGGLSHVQIGTHSAFAVLGARSSAGTRGFTGRRGGERSRSTRAGFAAHRPTSTLLYSRRQYSNVVARRPYSIL